MSAQRCVDCHVESAGIPLTTAERAHRQQEHNQLCLECHDLGAHSNSPHGVKGDQLAILTQRIKAGDTPPPLVQRAAQVLASGGPAELACATCHREHHGREADLQRLSDRQC